MTVKSERTGFLILRVFDQVLLNIAAKPGDQIMPQGFGQVPSFWKALLRRDYSFYQA